jgi:hypothetical protein
MYVANGITNGLGSTNNLLRKKKTLANTNLSNNMAQMVRKQKSFKFERELSKEQ